jgi:Icc-related predicted phosphoesterase
VIQPVCTGRSNLHRGCVSWIVLLCIASFLSAQPIELRRDTKAPFRFVIYGDTRFTDSSNTEAANPMVRRALVQAIAEAHPAFIAIAGDITYRGDQTSDWRVWDTETAAWQQEGIPIYPALGNHDLHGDEKVALGNYFRRFPALVGNRYYSLHAGNTLMLVLDSSLDELSGPQGEWLSRNLDNIPQDVSFVFILLHHPPYTSSSDKKTYGGGHSARRSEELLAKNLEKRQQHAHFRFIVFAGHVHNYERHEHSGVTYLVTGGGGAHAYPIERAPSDAFQSKDINYHYLLVSVEKDKLTITMNRIELKDGNPMWTQPDLVTIPAISAVAHAGVAPGTAVRGFQ